MCVEVGVRDDRESGMSSAESDRSSMQRTHIVGVSPGSGSGAGSGAERLFNLAGSVAHCHFVLSDVRRNCPVVGGWVVDARGKAFKTIGFTWSFVQALEVVRLLVWISIVIAKW